MIIHFSYPQVVVLSMYVAWVAIKFTGGSMFAGIAAAVVSAVLANMVCAPLFQKVMQKRGEVDINSTMVVSMGIGMIITDVLSHTFNHGFPVAFPEALGGSKPLIHFGLISLRSGQVAALAIGVVAVGGLFLLLYRTRAGRAFRAIAEDPAGARLVGIPLLSTGLASYAVTGILGGVSAILLAMILGAASPGLGEQVAHKVLAVSIIAGLGNLVGGLAVGLGLGVLEALVQGYVSGTWSNAIAFVIMLVVILVKPRGLFGIKL
jgi:branched-chain amino acid transport system permease protein